jgi:shikimate kinase
MSRPIILTGFMSSGKTTVAAALGERLGCSVIDLDEAITKIKGRTPREIITEDGEDAFREAETRELRTVLTARNPQVIALGGGAWILQRNRDLVQQYDGISIWLDAPFELCWQRIPDGGGERPLAKNKDAAQELYEERRPYYALAQVRIEVDPTKTVDRLVEEIAAMVSVITTKDKEYNGPSSTKSGSTTVSNS